MTVYAIELDHTFDAAHRVVGHEDGNGKCARLHGHTYTVRLHMEAAALDEVGFVIDFGVAKRIIDEWDHRTLLWVEDELYSVLAQHVDGSRSLVGLDYNPTSENMARDLAELLLIEGNLSRVDVTLSETPRSRAFWTATA